MAAAKKTTVEQTEVEVEKVEATSIDFDSFERERERERKRVEAQRAAQQSQLNEPFPHEVERQLKKSGTYLTYIPVSEVITRLNKVLGFDGWSYQIIKCERDAIDPDFIVAHVRLDVYPHADRFVAVSKDGFGGQKIKRTKQGDIVDLGDEFKGAVSDALKKAAQSLGIGLYLARTEEAMELDEEKPVVASAPEQPQVSALYESFIDLRKALDETGVESIRAFWSEYSGGRPVPKPHEFTDAELEALIGECVRLSFNGTYAENE
jgi:hypothetical protein